MAGGGAKAEPEEELSSRSSSGGDSEKWETSEEGRTNSKGKLLPDGFLDPLPPQKSLKRPRFCGMVEGACKQGQRRVKRRDALREDIMDSKTLEVHPSIANLRGLHRAAHPNEGTILGAASHLLMANEWQVRCPRFIDALEHAGIACIRHLQFIRLDHHLITALVERWCPQTNTFHLPVGEMTITLQDVQIILGVRTDGPALVGPIAIGLGHRWLSWPDCCDELLGSHPEEDVVYHHPSEQNQTSNFRMGSAQARTCIPLRWLRWTFYRESYMDLTMNDLLRHVRAYILYMLGCFLLPDTSGSHMHLQYLPLLEDLGEFSQYSLGGSILAHLYRELKEATKPTRVYMAGCLHLLQVWAWERLHVGRPTLHVPFPRDITGKPLGYRWNEERVREVPIGNVRMYRDEIDGLQQSQVIWEPYTPALMVWLPKICVDGMEIWQARVPLISWKRVEWHLPDRVMRQFGGRQLIELEPMERTFRRVDGRGRANVDWMEYHYNYIEMWNKRRAYIIVVTPRGDDQEDLLRYMHWYRSWASLYLLKAPIAPPNTYYPKAPVERIMMDYYVRSKCILRPFFGGKCNGARAMQLAIDEVASLCNRVESAIHIDFGAVEDPIRDNTHRGTSPSSVVGAGASRVRDQEPSSSTNQ
ncbi:serine/threonine-protein phosphatase 7 long form homolog [Dendrobium catenatum]|uniref:serine/threonine-protein phosphatase 7 long form homolog n=1 Tax=Dendrobium catenatum TaxID=906689 RepID=UPI0009F346E2|nr:serine/threonine-protein phosphatase 7 long form homolog [Dendrobium catenatum]